MLANSRLYSGITPRGRIRREGENALPGGTNSRGQSIAGKWYREFPVLTRARVLIGGARRREKANSAGGGSAEISVKSVGGVTGVYSVLFPKREREQI